MLGSFIIILFIFLGAYVAGIAYLFYLFPNEVEMAANELEKTIPYYDPTKEFGSSISSMFWDTFQPILQCCGVQGTYYRILKTRVYLTFATSTYDHGTYISTYFFEVFHGI